MTVEPVAGEPAVVEPLPDPVTGRVAEPSAEPLVAPDRPLPPPAQAPTKATATEDRPVAARSPAAPDRPHVRLGIAWAVVLAAGVMVGPAGLAVVLAAASVAAAADLCRTAPARPPYPAVSAATAAIVVGLALAGGAVLVGAAAVAGAVLAAAAWRARRKPEGEEPAVEVQQRSAAWGPVFAAAPASVVVLAQRSMAAAAVLLVAACLYDAGAYLVGTGSVSRWEGPAAGVMALVPFVVIVGSAFDPPFHHGSGWILGAALALMPFGPVLAGRLVRDQRAVAVRRLDVLLLAAPAWAVLAVVLGVG